jgi:phosphatidylglycerol---prolipoprotein diacylglyceryl transferase
MESKKKNYKRILYFITFIVFLLIFTLALRGIVQIPQKIVLLGINFNFYGLIVGISVLVLYSQVEKYYPDKQDRPKLADSLLWILFPSLFFARLYYVVLYWDYFAQSPQDIVKFWEGGIALWGVLFGGFVGLVLFCKFKKLKLVSLLETIAIFLPLAQAIGRLANFINQEIVYLPTNLPWGMYVQESKRPLQYLDREFFHPLFLYEMLANFLLFQVLYRIFKKRGIDDKIFFASIYLLGYSFIRFFLDFVRPEPQIVFFLKHSQVLSMVIFIANLVYLLVTYRGRCKNPKPSL